MNRRDL